MSILDMFRQTPAQAPAPVAQPAPAGNIQDPATLAAGHQVPNTPPAAPAPGSAAPNTPDNPLAQFADLWKNEPKPVGEQAPAQGLGLTQEAVQAIVAKTDFSQVISPDHMAAISAGGDGAQAALAQAMNQVAQHVMVQSTMVNNKLAEKQIEMAIQAQLAKLPETMRHQASTDHLKSTNPLFSNPAIQPVIEATHAQLLAKFPQATHAEIAKMTQDYVLAMGNAFSPKPEPSAQESIDNTDWTKFLS